MASIDKTKKREPGKPLLLDAKTMREMGERLQELLKEFRTVMVAVVLNAAPGVPNLIRPDYLDTEDIIVIYEQLIAEMKNQLALEKAPKDNTTVH